MPEDRQVLTKRLAAFVRPYPAKVLAQKIGCTERVAENIRKGHWPIARHWLALVRLFGRDLTECVFHPEAAAERLQREVADLAAQLAQKEAQLKLVHGEARSFATGRPQASARNEDGTAGVDSSRPAP